MKRRELFSSFVSALNLNADSKEKITLIRPPYYADESLFLSECINCDGKCALVCKEKIINITKDSTPYLDFSKSGCTYCDECALACEFGVLSLKNKRRVNANIAINKKKCLSWNAVMCFSCKDPCLEDAIDFYAMFMPVIDQDKCTSCGFCISRCPSNAIDIKVL